MFFKQMALPRRNFSNARAVFDTNALITSLSQRGGMSEARAAKLSYLLNKSLGPKLDEISCNCVTRANFEQELGGHNLEMGKIKSESILRQTQAHHSSKLALEQILRELRANKQRTREALGTIRSEMRLEISLERGKQRDLNLQNVLKFQDMQTKVEAEVGNARAASGKLRHDIFYSLAGLLFTSAAALLGYLRYYN